MFIFVFSIQSAHARTKTIKVFALEDFSTREPSLTYNIQIIDDDVIGSQVIRRGAIISGDVIKVEGPKRGKRNAYFEFIPTSYIYNDVSETFKTSCVARVVGYKELDPQKAAVYLARKASNLVFKGASIGIAFVEGVAKANEGTRLKSGFISAYKDTPLSYIEEGSELEVRPGDIIILKFKEVQ